MQILGVKEMILDLPFIHSTLPLALVAQKFELPKTQVAQ